MMEQEKTELQDDGDPLVFQTRLADAAPINIPLQASDHCPVLVASQNCQGVLG